ncbi:MAG: ABC transporter permease [Alphaproteobacteria bacterium]|nr:ABC transporter permease [Alphaproteobacteria bacterium]
MTTRKNFFALTILRKIAARLGLESQLDGALEDVGETLRTPNLWAWMAWSEIRRRYRRTVLGPFWTTGSLAIFVGALGILYATLWNQDVNKYLPYLTAGFTVWIFISQIITESCNAYVSAEGHLKQIRTPYSVFIFALIIRNLIVFAHHLIVYIIIVIFFPVPIGLITLLAIPGLAFIAFNAVWLGWVFGAFGSRFRDIPQLVASLLQVMFFITPIIWPATLTGSSRVIFVEMNPFYHFVSIVRDPMLGIPPDPLSWLVVLGITIVGWTGGLLFFARVRQRLIYWL